MRYTSGQISITNIMNLSLYSPKHIFLIHNTKLQEDIKFPYFTPSVGVRFTSVGVVRFTSVGVRFSIPTFS